MMSRLIIILSFCSIAFLGCRKSLEPQPAEGFNFINGLYLLNEGNMSMNKASLDFYDLSTGIYERDVYKRANPDVVLSLGDVGNDIQLYGSKLYIVVNASNKIEVLDARTTKRIKKIDLINCRYITFYNGKAYVSSYNASIGVDPASPNGKVVEIDTASLSISRTTSVGRQPDGVAAANNKLYVANSGGYNPNAYERTVSVIDLKSFNEIKRIDVEINLHRVKADNKGNIFVNSRGDGHNTRSNFFMIDSQKDEVVRKFDVPVSNFWIDDEHIYTYASEWSNINRENSFAYNQFSSSDLGFVKKYITDGSEKTINVPYGIAVNQQTKDIFITDAKNYVTSGTLHHYNANGKLLRSFTTGDIPGHMVFIGP